MRTILAFATATIMLAGCSTNNVTTDDSLGQYFSKNNATGTFAVMNNADGQFVLYNLARYRDSAYAPAQTFDIVSGLAGLQTGALASDTARLPVACGADANPTFSAAFQGDCAPFFAELARRIGHDTLQRWTDSLGYGSRKLAPGDSAAFDGSLRVKADEQLGLVKRLYFNQLPFFKLNQELVKKAMQRENTSKYRLAWKSGETRGSAGTLVWYTGWVEENNHPYFFAMNFHTEKPNARATGLGMLKEMLQHLGYLEGKK
ncbi:class D beta-lactamase [Flaviaesturariibacter flavus]|uniref:Class D beta-lactamase n=1 Tax=Flaviaesturariibacter flavus TaxID=2502780 RepID=A0A4R1BAY4_9BACT|nr:class D beta-lactamase [Flaviaesturariibacter flavus]TCJ14156.1 class D beta-lactamase [Flaviaesturariibacter flavus]